MKDYKVTAAVVLDPRRPKKDGNYPLKLRITYRGRQKYYSINEDASLSEWKRLDRDLKKIRNEEDRQRKKKLNSKVEDAELLISKIKHFTFSQFENDYLKSGQSYNTLSQAITSKIKSFEFAGKYSSANVYSCAKASLFKFSPNVDFRDITPRLLTKYVHYMRKENISDSTTGMYLRSIRSIFNDAINDGNIPSDIYPFGKKFQIPKGVAKPRALGEDDLINLLEYEPAKGEELYFDLWKFSYYGNGMNFRDVSKLKYSNIYEKHLEFVRSKTRNTTKNPKIIRVFLTNKLRQIIDKHGRGGNGYIFPILNDDIPDDKSYEIIKRFIKRSNKVLKEIGKSLELNIKLTTYVARHSHATTAIKKKAPIRYIQEALGHSEVGTTEAYLDSLGMENLEEYSKLFE